jgi:ABC-type multidrug transport system permease subunit
MSEFSSLRELYITRLREFYRQPARIFWVYGFPTVLAIGLGLAFQSRPPQTIRVDLVDSSSPPSAVSRAFEKPEVREGKTGRAGIEVVHSTEMEARHRLERGDTPLVVSAADDGRITYVYDPTRPDAAAARAAVDDAIQRALGRKDAVASHDIALTELGTRYIDFLIPGLIGVNTMGGGLWGIGFLLVNFRIAKLLKRFQATPMPRHNFLLAILGARMTFLIPDVGVLLLMGHFLFQMPIRGNWGLIALVEVCGALAFAGIGLLIASRAQTTETVSGLMNLVMLPMWLFSGVFFKSTAFPAMMQPFIQALPLTQLNNALRAVILQGAGIGEVWPALLILAVWAAFTFLFALRIFRWN